MAKYTSSKKIMVTGENVTFGNMNSPHDNVDLIKIAVTDAAGANSYYVEVGAKGTIKSSAGADSFQFEGKSTDYSIKASKNSVTVIDVNKNAVTIKFSDTTAKTLSFSDGGTATLTFGGKTVALNGEVIGSKYTPVDLGIESLTNGTDIVSGHIINAGLVYTPGGNDRINSLQDEDVLTGTSATNDELNVTLGNNNDNASATVAPTMTGIEIVNVAFTGDNGTNTLDFQDASDLEEVNITRVNNNPAFGVINMEATTTNISISDSSAYATANVTYRNAEIGGNETVNIALDGAALTLLNVGAQATETNHINTIALDVNGDSHIVRLDMNAGSAETATQTLSINADANLILARDDDNADGLDATDNNGNFMDDNSALADAGMLQTINITGTGDVTLGSVSTRAAGMTLAAGTASGDIAVNISNADGIAASSFTTGSGSDTVVSNGLLGDVVTNAGNDTVTLTGDLDYDAATVQAGTISTGEGNDTVTVTGNIEGGVGRDEVRDNGVNPVSVDTGAGDDTLTFGVFNTIAVVDVRTLGEEATISMGDGNDTLTMAALTDGDTGTADGDTNPSSIDMGAGNDTVVVDFSGKVDQGDVFTGTLAGGEGTNTLTFTGNASATATESDATNADRVTGFQTLNLISEDDISAALAATIFGDSGLTVTVTGNDANSADYTVDASEFTGLTTINMDNQAGVTNLSPQESSTSIRYSGDDVNYTINNWEDQTLTLTTVEALTSVARGTRIGATVLDDTNVDATLIVTQANIATGATETTTDTLSLTLAGAGDVSIDDQSVAGTGVLDDIENLNLTVNGSASRTINFDDAVAGVAATNADFEGTMTVTGDTTGTLTMNGVEANTFTSTVAGSINATFSGTTAANEVHTITTSDTGGADVIDLTADTVDRDDAVSLGAGRDELVVANSLRLGGADADEVFEGMNSIEILTLQGAGTQYTLDEA